ncbi:MAG: single-stranded DNA-binding protein [Candidatus Thorarchaeota archaeon]|jgi:single-strand DNA-binding protein
MNYNRVVFGGNIGNDLELKTTDSGREVLNFRMASNEKFNRANGDRVERTTWVSMVAWGDVAVRIARYFKKGDPILIEGRLQENRWQDKESGDNRSKLEVTVDRFYFVGGRRTAAPDTPTVDGPELPFDDASADGDSEEVPV